MGKSNEREGKREAYQEENNLFVEKRDLGVGQRVEESSRSRWELRGSEGWRRRAIRIEPPSRALLLYRRDSSVSTSLSDDERTLDFLEGDARAKNKCIIGLK